MLEQIQHHQATAGFQDIPRSFQRSGRFLRMVQGLAEQGQIHRAGFNGRRFDVAQAVFQIVQPVFARQLLPQLHHAGGVIHGDHLFGAGGDELGNETFPGSQVRHYVIVQNAEQCSGQRFPGTAWRVVLAQTAHYFVKIGLGAVFALVQDNLKGFLVRFRLRQFLAGFQGYVVQIACQGKSVKDIFAGTGVLHHPFLPELGQLGGDAALPHAENFLKFRDAQGFFIQNVDDAQAGGICQEFERF